MRKLVAITLLALLAITTANAATITETEAIGPSIPTFGQTLNFNQFDTSLGTLTSIEVILILNSDGGSLTLDNDGVDPASGNFDFGSEGDISSSDVTLLNAAFSPVTATANAYHTGAFSLAGNVGDGSGDYDPTGPDGMLYTGSLVTDTQSDFIGSTFWGSGTVGFLGTGTYDIEFDATQVSNFGGIGGIEYAVTPMTAYGSLEIIYTYDPIPEPTTIALLSAGVFGLLRKRKTA